MSLIQVNIDDNLKKAIWDKAAAYGVPASSLIKIVLVRSFLHEADEKSLQPGNVFNADRDNNGNGLKIEDLISAL
jgi:hypothetical protein